MNRIYPALRGVHLQPVSYFGRYPSHPDDRDRITIPQVIRALESQTEGLASRHAFKPSGCENTTCSFHGNFVVMPGGELRAWTRHYTETRVEATPGALHLGHAVFTLPWV